MNPGDRLDEALQQTHLARKDLGDGFLAPFRRLSLKMAEMRLSSVYKSMTGEQWVPPEDLDKPSKALDEEGHRLANAEPAQQPEEGD